MPACVHSQSLRGMRAIHCAQCNFLFVHLDASTETKSSMHFMPECVVRFLGCFDIELRGAAFFPALAQLQSL